MQLFAHYILYDSEITTRSCLMHVKIQPHVPSQPIMK